MSNYKIGFKQNNKKNKIIATISIFGLFFGGMIFAMMSLRIGDNGTFYPTGVDPRLPIEIWNNTLASGVSDGDYGIAVSSNNSIYITGRSHTPVDFSWIAKYNSSGHQLWNRTYLGVLFHKINIDTQGYIYAIGRNDTENSLYIAKCDALGNSIWNDSKKILDENSFGYDLAISEDDDIYITGQADSSLFLAKYNSSGTILWNTTFNSTGYDIGFGIKIYNNESIYLCGQYNSTEYWIIKTDMTGSEIWNVTWGSNNIDMAYDIDISITEDIYVTGAYNASKNISTIKLNSTGNIIWNKTFDTGSSFDRGYSIYVYENNQILLGGTSLGAFGRQCTIINYNSSGDISWIYNWSIQGATGSARIFDMAFSLSRDLYIVGNKRPDSGSNWDIFLTRLGFIYPPVLTNGQINNTLGFGVSDMMFSINYTDYNNESPIYMRVIVNGTQYDMVKNDSTDNLYLNGVIYNYTKKFPKGVYEFYFETSDGINITRFPEIGNLSFVILNTNPELLSANVLPTTGVIGTIFNFNVSFYDNDNDTPTSIKIWINNTGYNMIKENVSDNNYIDGVVYNFSIQLNISGIYEYFFNATDGTNNTRLPTITVYTLTVTLPITPSNNLLLWIILSISLGIGIFALLITDYKWDWLGIF